MNTALMWLHTCKSAHEICQRSSTGFLPTRLLDVKSESRLIRLTLGSSLPPDTQYLTLSHCWGGKTPVRLSKCNYFAMLENISFNELPRTFQDVIGVTRKLGYRYIWIDSLCIIQDDPLDWQRESSMMHKFYSTSQCNIAATAAKDSTEGLFSRRPILGFPQLKVKLPLIGAPKYFYLYVSDSWLWKSGVENTPLIDRAWVFQERLLSRCNLHFGSDKLYWECRHLSTFETTHSSLDKGTGYPEEMRMKSQISSSSGIWDQQPGRNQKAESLKLWQILVRAYSGSNLTFESDRLVAISGLAEKWAAVVQDQYFAGLWRSNLPRLLLWSTENPQPNYWSREYTAPSWSWASAGTQIKWGCAPWYHNEHHIETIEVTILECAVELASDNIYGALNHASLKVRGCLCAVEVQAAHEHSKNPTKLLLKTYPDEGIHFLGNFSWDMRGDDLTKLINQMPFQRFLLIRIAETESCDLHGLMARTEERKTFRRVGCFIMKYSCPIGSACKYFDESEEGELLREGDNNRRYTITLV